MFIRLVLYPHFAFVCDDYVAKFNKLSPFLDNGSVTPYTGLKTMHLRKYLEIICACYDSLLTIGWHCRDTVHFFFTLLLCAKAESIAFIIPIFRANSWFYTLILVFPHLCLRFRPLKSSIHHLWCLFF